MSGNNFYQWAQQALYIPIFIKQIDIFLMSDYKPKFNIKSNGNTLDKGWDFDN